MSFEIRLLKGVDLVTSEIGNNSGGPYSIFGTFAMKKCAD